MPKPIDRRRPGAGRRPGAYRPLNEINVTPFVDVMLVLLIVFMVAAPLLSVGVPVQLPRTKAAALPTDLEPLTVTVSADGTVYVQNTPMGVDEVVPALVQLTSGNRDAQILIRGDQSLAYGTMLQVMGLLNRGGYRNLGLVSDQAQDQAMLLPVN